MIADLYDGVFQIEFENFRLFALEQSSRIVARDRMLWGTGVRATQTILNITLINLDPGGLLKYQSKYAHNDVLLVHALENPGVPVRYEDLGPDGRQITISGAEDGSLDDLFAQIMVTCSRDPNTDLSEILAQYRDDPQRVFTDGEREDQRLLFPHMVAAWRHRQLLRLYEESKGEPLGHAYGERGNAVVNADGMLEAADSLFSQMILARFPTWKGPFLPSPVAAMLTSSANSSVIDGLEFKLTRGDARHILSVSQVRGADALTPAERRVADLFAEGHSYALVAKRLGVSKSTVRNQISAVYRKLDIHSKVELVRVSQR